MAFRSAAVAFASSGAVTATPASVAAHDYLGASFLLDSSSNTLTPPSGWTQQTVVQWASSSPDGQEHFYADKNDASGADSFQFTDSAGLAARTLICAAWTGRNNTTPLSTTPVTTKNTSSNASPISATITGITATASDDIAIWPSTDQTAAAGRWTFSTISGYAERQDGIAQDWTSGLGLQTLDNASAGATGNFAVTITNSATGNSGYGGIVVAIAATGGGGSTRPVKMAGSWGGFAGEAGGFAG